MQNAFLDLFGVFFGWLGWFLFNFTYFYKQLTEQNQTAVEKAERPFSVLENLQRLVWLWS